MALTAEQFGKAVVASGLMTAEELRALWAELPVTERPKDGESFSTVLLKRERLNEFQAKELLSLSNTPLVFGDYVLLSKIGAGGMGQVFKAHHRRMDRLAAIKLLPASLTKDEATVKRFEREVKAAAKLSHPNIVQTFDAGVQRGVHYLVMEHVDGRDLSAIVKERGPLPVNEAIDCIVQAARGLAFAHGKGVVHRDIKPANLLLDSEGVVKILDMGLARIDSTTEAAADHQLTNTGTVMGTVDYMSPEQATNTHNADARSDIYSLGCSLYRLLTGGNVYEGATAVEKILAHVGRPVPSLLAQRADCPAEIDRIFQKMLAKKPEDRYQQAAQLVAELEAFRNPGATASFTSSSDSNLTSFLQTLNSPKGTATQAAQPSVQTSAKTEQTMVHAGAEVETDPKSEIVAPQKAATKAEGEKRKAGGGQKPPVKLIAAGAAGALLLMLLGVWVIIRDKDGNEVARVKVPDGGTVTVQNNTPAKAATPPTATPMKSAVPTTQSAKTSTPPTVSPKTASPTSPSPALNAAWTFADWKTLFDGSSLNGWTGETNKLTVENGVLVNDGQKGTVSAPGTYRDFEVELEFRLRDKGNSGLGICYSGEGDPALNGLEVQLLDDAGYSTIGLDQRCGALYKLVAARQGFYKKWPEWNRVVARSLGDELEVELNGTSVVKTTRQALAVAHPTHAGVKRTSGSICLFPHTSRSEYRNFRVREATRSTGPLDTNPPPTATVIDLLAGVDVNRDAVVGKFTLVGGLKQTDQVAQARIYLPTAAIPAEYDLNYSVARTVAGGKALMIGFVWQGKQGSVVIDGFSSPPASGLEMVDGKSAKENGTYRPGERIALGSKHDLVIRVRNDGVTVLCDASMVFEWKGQARQLSTHAMWDVPRKDQLFVGFQGPYVVHAARLTPIGASLGPPLAKAPFDAAGAKAHQQSWAKYLGVDVVKPNSIGMQMTLIPPGEFLMGSSDADITLALKIAEETKLDAASVIRIQEERPQHRVRITKPFRLAVHEVTIGQFAKFVAQTKYKTQAEEFGGNSYTVKHEELKPENLKLTWRTPGQTITDDSPVTQVSWNDAAAFCNWLSEQEKQEPCYQRDGDSWALRPKANGYRLPTEAEWEYACRAGTATQFWFGDDWKELDKYGWTTKNADSRPHAVGLLPANPFGLYDMHGNVWEWCQDGYDSKWYEKSPSDDPLGPNTASHRMLRGGCWLLATANGRSSYRYNTGQSNRNNTGGFRVALSSVGAQPSTASITTSTPPVVTPPPVAKPVGPAPTPAKAPFDAAGAKAHQQAWAKHLGTEVETTNSVGAKMVLIPPGEFLMGSTDEQVEAALKVAEEMGVDQPTKDRIQKNERPQHKVVISKPFLMGATEVTVGQFKKFSATGYQTEAEKAFAKDAKVQTYVNPGYAVTDDSPTTEITWNDATAYCQWLSTQEKATYRLPTEAEWEYACRAGTTTQYSFGDDVALLYQYGWYKQNAADHSHPVGRKLWNGFGLFDMHGNLHEWCGDYFDEKWYSASPLNDPSGPVTGSNRVIRGGHWNYLASTCRSAYRHSNIPSNRHNKHGFRVVRELGAPSTPASVTPQPAAPAAAASGKLFMHDPAFEQWMKDVQAMTAEKQIEAVSKKLMELNPGFDGKVTDSAGRGTPKIEAGVVTQYGFYTAKVTDISPVRALSGLKSLRCTGLSQGGAGDRKLTNLSPLSGMHLTFLDCTHNYQLFDLSPLKEMSLLDLHCFSTQVSDLSPLQSCKRLQTLRVGRTKVTPASVAALQKALPNCKIEWDDPAKPTVSAPTASGTK